MWVLVGMKCVILVSDTDTLFREMGSLADESESPESGDLGNVGRSCSLANCDSQGLEQHPGRRSELEGANSG